MLITEPVTSGLPFSWELCHIIFMLNGILNYQVPLWVDRKAPKILSTCRNKLKNTQGKLKSRLILQVSIYLVVLLSSHVGPQEALDGDCCRAQLLVACPRHPHAQIPLDDDSCSGSLQKHNIAEQEKEKKKKR